MAATGSSVIGVIDGKFESGYIVTVTMGSEKLKGVLYHAPQNPATLPPFHNNNNNASAAVHSRRRRKKSEIKRKDPALPKPKRTGYNFFFAEQHAILKLHHQAKETEIGELWTKLTESQKMVYQEMAIKDKERYTKEMEDYLEKLKMDQVIVDAVPLRRWPPQSDADIQMDEAEADSPQTPGEASFGGNDYEERGFVMGATSYLGSEEKPSKGGF